MVKILMVAKHSIKKTIIESMTQPTENFTSEERNNRTPSQLKLLFESIFKLVYCRKKWSTADILSFA